MTTAHDDICVIFQSVEEQKYELNIQDALKALCMMKVWHMAACWTCYISPKSVVLVECDYNQSVWNEIWKELRRYYDIVKPQKPCRIREMQRKIIPLLATYIKEESRNLGEVRRLCGKYGQLAVSKKFSAYYKSPEIAVKHISNLNDDEFTNLAYE